MTIAAPAPLSESLETRAAARPQRRHSQLHSAASVLRRSAIRTVRAGIRRGGARISALSGQGRYHLAMAVKLNHTIVHARDKQESASFYAEVFGLARPTPFGPF